MSLLETKPSRIQVLISYSEDHKKEMAIGMQKSCQSIADLVRDIVEKEIGGKVIKVAPLGRGFADLLIEGSISDSGKLGKLEIAMEKINQNIGVEKVYVFAKSV